MEEILVSIIVPVYNSEKYIQRCIDSLINQTISNIEIILINDGSTDNSLKILNEYAKKDIRIKIIDKENGGVSSARNSGIEVARGRYISFVDADDWCEENMFELMYDMAEKHNCDIVTSGYSMDNVDGKNISTKIASKSIIANNEQDIGKVIHNSNISYAFTKLYKRNIINDNDIRFNEKLSMGEDATFVCDYLMNINSAGVINRSLYHYVRCNSESLSTKFVENISDFIEGIWERLDILYAKYPEFKRLEHIDGSSKLINRSKMYIYNNYRKNCNLTRRERQNYIKYFMNDNKLSKDMVNYKPKGFIDKLYYVLYKTGSPLIMDFVYSLRLSVVKIINFIIKVKK